MSGDFLHAIYWGTRQALTDMWREPIMLAVNDASQFAFAVLIILFDRAAGLYTSSVNINAYRQSSVEAREQASTNLVANQTQVLEFLSKNRPTAIYRH